MSDQQQQGDTPFWKSLFEWSMKYQEDGSTISQDDARLSVADREWLEDALKHAMVDLSKRMTDIKDALDEGQEISVEEKEQMLDELLELVESIDQAKDLSTIGGLQTLLQVLDSGVPSLQWRAAEVIATCAQNNPEVQTSFFSGGVMDPIWRLMDSEDDVCVVKALLAVSCLIRGSSQVHSYFTENHGASRLIDMVHKRGGDDRILRKCLQILRYCIEESAIDRAEVVESGEAFTSALAAILGDDTKDSDVHQVALDVSKALGAEAEGLALMKDVGQ